jgi:hypothetical protein
MNRSFAPLSRTLSVLALCALTSGIAVADQPAAADNATAPSGHKYKACHGYVRHVSDTNMRVHCIDGNASDQSFLYVPRFASLKSGKTVQVRELAPETPVIVYYTQSLGVKKAYRVYVTDDHGRTESSVRT